MTIANLKNGAEEDGALVTVVMIGLENLMNSNPIAACELVEMCKNNAHKPFGNAGAVLGELGLLIDGTVHGSVRNIVLSAFEGEGLNMRLTNPMAR